MEMEKVTQTRKPNKWLEHVKEVRLQNPKLMYKEVLVIAKDTYKPMGKVDVKEDTKEVPKTNKLKRVRKFSSKDIDIDTI